jgi:hypothetical protein
MDDEKAKKLKELKEKTAKLEGLLNGGMREAAALVEKQYAEACAKLDHNNGKVIAWCAAMDKITEAYMDAVVAEDGPLVRNVYDMYRKHLGTCVKKRPAPPKVRS